MTGMLTREGEEEPPKRIKLPPNAANTWQQNDKAFHKVPAQDVVHQLHVTNDYTESGVAFVQNYVAKILAGLHKIYFWLSVVAKHRMDYPTAKRRPLLRCPGARK